MKNTRIAAVAAVVTLPLALTACGGGSGFNSSSGSSASGGAAASQTPNSNPLTVLIGSSGDAETAAVKSAVAAWSAKSGVKATVVPASSLDQQAAQGFAAGKPADIIYTSAADMNTWAKAGNLMAYGDQLPNKDDFYPALKQAFTYKNQFYCAPKDVSTLQLVINTDLWKKAGLTDADYPKTWDDLEKVSKKLTQGSVKGLTFSPQIERLGVFMAQAGGGLTNTDGTQATVDQQANVDALTYVKKLLTEGVAASSSDLGEGWGGDAFGKGKAAMAIEGNWITGTMQKTYPNVKYTVVELPKGKQAGTLEFTNCWGIAAKSQNQAGAISLVESLTTKDQQLAFAKAFGVMPSLQSAKDDYTKANPAMAPFVAGISYAQNLPAAPGTADVITDFDSKLGSLAKSDPKTILTAEQKNLAAALQG